MVVQSQTGGHLNGGAVPGRSRISDITCTVPVCGVCCKGKPALTPTVVKSHATGHTSKVWNIMHTGSRLVPGTHTICVPQPDYSIMSEQQCQGLVCYLPSVGGLL